MEERKMTNKKVKKETTVKIITNINNLDSQTTNSLSKMVGFWLAIQVKEGYMNK